MRTGFIFWSMRFFCWPSHACCCACVSHLSICLAFFVHVRTDSMRVKCWFYLDGVCVSASVDLAKNTKTDRTQLPNVSHLCAFVGCWTRQRQETTAVKVCCKMTELLMFIRLAFFFGWECWVCSFSGTFLISLNLHNFHLAFGACF